MMMASPQEDMKVSGMNRMEKKVKAHKSSSAWFAATENWRKNSDSEWSLMGAQMKRALPT